MTEDLLFIRLHGKKKKKKKVEFGDPSLMTKIGLLVGQRANQLVAFGSDVAVAGQSKSCGVQQ